MREAQVEAALGRAMWDLRGRDSDRGSSRGTHRGAAQARLRLMEHRDGLRDLRQAGRVLSRLLLVRLMALHDGGWPPGDVRELVGRRDPGMLSHLELLEAGDADALARRLTSEPALLTALRLGALLGEATLLDASARSAPGPGRSETDHPQLRRVRALLAKAESTEFEEEADALVTKAQELITRHSLEELAAASPERSRTGDGLAVRRLWLDPPYVDPKASLVAQVALANRCRTAVNAGHGYCLVVGSPADLDGVELLVTSLLVQADGALLRRRPDAPGWGGPSRTRSFRRAFWLGFATRVGQRLQDATATATEAASTWTSTPRAGGLLPVLAAHYDHVAATFDQWVPHTTRRATTISNRDGWAAGTAAADEARIGLDELAHRRSALRRRGR